jgi:hypothetical protein
LKMTSPELRDTHAQNSTPVIGPVQLKVHMAGSIDFPEGKPIVETLEEIKTEIENTLRRFTPDFEQ